MYVQPGYLIVKASDGYAYVLPEFTAADYRAAGEKAVEQYEANCRAAAAAHWAEVDRAAAAITAAAERSARKKARHAANLAARRIADRERSMRAGK